MSNVGGFLAGRPKIRGNYNKLGQAEQQQFGTLLQDQGGKAARQYAKGMVGTSPRPAGQGASIGNKQFKLNDPRGIVNMQNYLNAQNQGANMYANRVNQAGPFGDTNYTQDPNSGQWTQTQQMSGQMQNLYNQTGQSLQFGNEAANPWSQDYSKDRQRVEDTVYNKFAGRMEPQFKQEGENLQQQLADQGVQFSDDPNSMYQRQLRTLDQRQNDLRSDARGQAVTMGGQEQSRMFGDALAGRSAYTGEQAQQWASPYNALGQMTQAQNAFSKSFNPLYTNSMDQMNYMGVPTQFYDWNTMDPRRHQWQMSQIGAQGGNQLAAIGAQGGNQIRSLREQALLNAEAGAAPP